MEKKWDTVIPADLEKTLCKWDIYVPLVTKGLKIRPPVGRDFLRILWKLDVHRWIRRRPPPVLILRQIYLVRVSLSYVWKIHFNIILPSKPRSSKWSFPLRFSHQNPACTSPLLLTCHKPRLSHSFWPDHPNNIWCTVQIVKPLNVQSALHCYLVLLGSRYLPQKAILEKLQPTFLPQCGRPSDFVTLRCLVTVKRYSFF